MFLVLDPVDQLLLELGQSDEMVLRLPQLRHGGAVHALRLDQLSALKGLAALLALVPSRLLVSAGGAGALDIAVREELVAGGAEILQGALLVQVALLEQFEKDLADHAEMVLGMGLGEQAELDVQPLDGPLVDLMVALRYLQGGGPLLLGPHRDGRPMLVGAGDHQHFVAAEAAVTGVEVGR